MTATEWALLADSGGLWFAGLRLFLRSTLPRNRKLTWSAFLLLVGGRVGFPVPGAQVWSEFLLVLANAAASCPCGRVAAPVGTRVVVLVRACAFEVCTVFGAAGVARALFDVARIIPFLERAE